jgi:hypothetical protein
MRRSIRSGMDCRTGDSALANLRVAPDRVDECGTIAIRVDVTNEGKRAAEETVFLFTHDKLASVARPKFELKGDREDCTCSPERAGTRQSASVRR